MEGQAPEIGTAQPVAPAPAPATMPTYTANPAPQMSDGGAIGSVTGGKMNIKDIVISSLLLVLSVYGILYYRKGLKKLDEQPSADDFSNMNGDIEELQYNVKKALGKKYQLT